MSLRKFELRHLGAAIPAIPATVDPEIGEKSQLSQLSQGVTPENQHSRFGAQADADALVLAVMIDDDPHVSLDVMRARAGAAGIIGNRWAFGLVALPEAHNGRRAPPC